MTDKVPPRVREAPAPAPAPMKSRSAPPGPEGVKPKAKPSPAPGTYVIQLPKEQIFRVPTPENARRYERLARRKPRRGCCCRLLCCLVPFLLLLALLLGALYLLVRPQSPHYSGRALAISGLNLTSPGPLSPAIDVSVRASNQNGRIGIYYEPESHVSVEYGDVTLCTGVLPAFYQPPRNVTAFVTALRGSVEIDGAARTELADGVRETHVPLTLRIRVPWKVKVGPVTSWQMTVNVKCEVVVDKLVTGAKVLSKHCGYRFYPW